MTIPQETELITVIRSRAHDLQIHGILVAGSFARDQVDEASDIDIVVLIGGERRFVQYGRWSGRDIEILYLPQNQLVRNAPSRATFKGARLIYGIDPQLPSTLSSLEETFEKGPFVQPIGYTMWDLAHGVRVLHHLQHEGEATFWYVYHQWIRSFVTYSYERSHHYAPTVRRQIMSLRDIDGDLADDVESALVDASSVKVALMKVEHLWKKYGEVQQLPLEFAPLEVLNE